MSGQNTKRNPSGNNGRKTDNQSLTPLAKKFLWADEPDRVQFAVLILAALSIVLFVIDLFYHRHAYFSFEQTSAFYAVTGFLAFTLIVLAAGQLRRLIKRPDDFYGEYSTNAEEYPPKDLERLGHDGQMDVDAAESSDGAQN